MACKETEHFEMEKNDNEFMKTVPFRNTFEPQGKMNGINGTTRNSISNRTVVKWCFVTLSVALIIMFLLIVAMGVALFQFKLEMVHTRLEVSQLANTQGQSGTSYSAIPCMSCYDEKT